MKPVGAGVRSGTLQVPDAGEAKRQILFPCPSIQMPSDRKCLPALVSVTFVSTPDLKRLFSDSHITPCQVQPDPPNHTGTVVVSSATSCGTTVCSTSPFCPISLS